MTTATPTRSAFPIAADDLVERVRALTVELGRPPSKRRVMAECRVGAPRAEAALAAVRDTAPTPDAPVPADAPAEPAAEVRPAGAPRPAGETSALVSAATVNAVAAPPPAAPTTAPAPAVEPSSGPWTTAVEDPDTAVSSPQVSTVVETPADAPLPAAVEGVPDTAPTAVDQAPAAPVAVVPDAPVAARAGVHALPRWPLYLIAAAAFVAIWGGWTGLGAMTGFGEIRLLPGILDDWVIDSAVVLPLGVEAYAGYALRAWLTGPEAGLSSRARRFAKWSALAALVLGAAGQITYHLLVAAQVTEAPWQITAAVATLPVIVLGCAAALAHLAHQPATTTEEGAP